MRINRGHTIGRLIRSVIVSTATALVMLFVSVGQATADVTPASWEHYGFVQVRNDGFLVQWQFDFGVGGYRSSYVDGGWGGTRLVTGLTSDVHGGWDFLEVKGDELVEWYWARNGTLVRNHRDWGWSNARLIAGLDVSHFVSINTVGVLVLWRWNWSAGMFLPICQNGGWNGTRMLAGLHRLLSENHVTFVEVKGDELVTWTWALDGNCGLTRYHSDWGWSNARHIAGMTWNTFVEVKDNGELVEWERTGHPHQYSGTHMDWGWDNTRLLG